MLFHYWQGSQPLPAGEPVALHRTDRAAVSVRYYDCNPRRSYITPASGGYARTAAGDKIGSDNDHHDSNARAVAERRTKHC